MSLILLQLGCQNTKKEPLKIEGNEQSRSELFEKGQDLFKGKGNCYSCHRINKKSIGPSVKEMVKIYREHQADMTTFLQQKAKPIVDPDNYSVMKTNFSVLKTFTDTELEALVTYMKKVSEE